jgi:hypothetical protein
MFHPSPLTHADRTKLIPNAFSLYFIIGHSLPVRVRTQTGVLLLSLFRAVSMEKFEKDGLVLRLWESRGKKQQDQMHLCRYNNIMRQDQRLRNGKNTAGIPRQHY